MKIWLKYRTKANQVPVGFHIHGSGTFAQCPECKESHHINEQGFMQVNGQLLDKCCNCGFRGYE